MSVLEFKAPFLDIKYNISINWIMSKNTLFRQTCKQVFSYVNF
jgi:hypothetical protein